MPEASTVYTERHGPSLEDGLGLLVCALFTACGALAQGPGILLALAFGAGAVVYLRRMSGHAIALAVDGHGITLGSDFPRSRDRPTVVPWSEIDAVVLWTQRVPLGLSTRYLGLRRTAGTVTGRAVTGWTLDLARLTAAVAAHAPHVAIVVRD